MDQGLDSSPACNFGKLQLWLVASSSLPALPSLFFGGPELYTVSLGVLIGLKGPIVRRSVHRGVHPRETGQHAVG